MSTFMEDAAGWLGEQLQNVAGRSVTYRRLWEHTALELTGVVTMRDYEVADEQGFLTLVRSWDWTFTASDLAFENGTRLIPQKGDEIYDENGTLYEPMPLGKRPISEPLDSGGVLIVIHTKLTTFSIETIRTGQTFTP